jgi:pheromone shutdown protein TraB
MANQEPNLLPALSSNQSENQSDSKDVLIDIEPNQLKNPSTSKNDVANVLHQEDQEDTIKIYDSIEEFDKNLPETVWKLETPNGNTCYLVGTAHFSEKSQDDVSFVIRNVRPDVVVVELCESRGHILRLDEKTLLDEAKDINMAKIRSTIKTNGYINGIFYVLLLNMSAKLTKELGMAPGGEFRRALDEASRIPNCIVHLGDRPINATLQRALRGLSMWQTLKLIWRLMVFDDTITIKEVEQCKNKDLLEELMKEMAGEFPAFGQVFVKERDMFLCHNMQMAARYTNYQQQTARKQRPVRVVGVVGIGHCAGIAKNWGKIDPLEIPKLLIIPPPSRTAKVCKFTLKYGTYSLMAYGLYRLARPYLPKLF